MTHCSLPGLWPSPLWLVPLMVGGLLAIAAPGQAGSAPSGSGSGVTVGGSSLLPLGAAPVGRRVLLESTSPNATVNPTTGEILLSVAAQQSLNQAAAGLLSGLRSNHPALAGQLATPGSIDLSAPSPLTVVETSNGADCTATMETTIGDLAAQAQAAVLAETGVMFCGPAGRITVAAPADGVPSTTVVFAPVGDMPVVLPLTGDRPQVANAAAWAIAAFAAGIAPPQVALFADLALTGADYRTLVPLFNAVGGLLPAAGASPVNPTQLEAAIQAYNAVLASSSGDTLVALSGNADFVALGRSLQQLRAAIDP